MSEVRAHYPKVHTHSLCILHQCQTNKSIEMVAKELTQEMVAKELNQEIVAKELNQEMWVEIIK